MHRNRPRRPPSAPALVVRPRALLSRRRPGSYLAFRVPLDARFCGSGNELAHPGRSKAFSNITTPRRGFPRGVRSMSHSSATRRRSSTTSSPPTGIPPIRSRFRSSLRSPRPRVFNGSDEDARFSNLFPFLLCRKEDLAFEQRSATTPHRHHVRFGKGQDV